MQTAHNRNNKFVTIFIVLTLKRCWSICKEFAWVALVGVVALPLEMPDNKRKKTGAKVAKEKVLDWHDVVVD